MTSPQHAAEGDEEGSDQGYEEGGLAEARAQRQQSHAQATSSGAATAKQEGHQKGPGFYAQTPDGTRFSAGSFSDLHLSRPLLKACAALGYTNPTPIQVPFYTFDCRLLTSCPTWLWQHVHNIFRPASLQSAHCHPVGGTVCKALALILGGVDGS